MRAVIYARYSIHNQREESIEDQVMACEAAARDAGDEVTEIREYTGEIPETDLTAGSEVSEAEAEKWIDLAQHVNDRPEYDDSPLNHVWMYSPSGKVVLP